MMDFGKRIKGKEGYAVILSFFYYFSVLGAYYILRPIRDQLAVEVGSGKLPRFFAWTFCATLLLTPLFSWLVSRWPRRLIMPFVYLIFIGCLMVFIYLFHHAQILSQTALGSLFFVWVSVFNLFAVSVFWSFMSDIWNDVQARRFYPIIAIGGICGAVVGPILAHTLVGVADLSFLLSISVGFLVLAILCILLLGKWATEYGVHRHKAGSESALGGGALDGLKQLFTNSFIGQMAVIMLLNDAIGTIAYFLITDYSGSTFPNNPIAQVRFAADMDLFANILQVFLQLTITRWLLVNYGARSVFMAAASIVVLASLTMLIVRDPYEKIIGIMPGLAILLILTRAISYGMIQPARETLYTLVGRDLRYKGKNAVDTVIWRGGDVLSTLSIKSLKSLDVSIAGFGVIWASLAAISGWIGWRLAKQIEKNRK